MERNYRDHQSGPSDLPTSNRQKYYYQYESDSRDQRSARTTYVNQKFGVEYTRRTDESDNGVPFSSSRKNAIEKSEFNLKEVNKELFVDPYSENKYRAIPYTQKELDGFDSLAKKLSDPKELSKFVDERTIENLNKYKQVVPNFMRDYKQSETEIVQSNGKKQVVRMPNELFKRKLSELPQELWTNMNVYVYGRLLIDMKHHPYTREVEINLKPHLKRKLSMRTLYTADQLKFICREAGLCHVKETKIGVMPTIPEYIVWVFRFSEITKEQHLKDEETNKKECEDFSNIDEASLASLIEDRVFVNVIVIPSYNTNFDYTKEASSGMSNNNNDKNTEKSDQVSLRAIESRLTPQEKTKMEANDLFAFGCIFYSI